MFEELDHQTTPMGEISLRRRREPVLDVDVFEAKLDDEFLMSTLFTVAEIALADLCLAEVDGLRHVLALLRPGGIFGLWSDAPPDPAFLAVLEGVFPSARAHTVPFDNPYTGDASSNTIYVGETDRR